MIRLVANAAYPTGASTVGEHSRRVEAWVYFVPDSRWAQCCMLAKNPVILEPAWSTMTLCLSDHEAAVCQQVARGLVCRLDRSIGQEA